MEKGTLTHHEYVDGKRQDVTAAHLEDAKRRLAVNETMIKEYEAWIAKNPE